MSKLIALVGPKQAGKTTVFDMIRDGQRVNEITIAGFLKDVCSAVFNVERSAFDDQAVKEKPLTSPCIIRPGDLTAISSAYAKILGGSLFLSSQFVGHLLRTPREIAQVVGTDILRDARETIHLDVAAKLVKENMLNVVTDVRFDNELAWTSSLGGESWYIYRPEADRVARSATHASESGVPLLKDRCDRVINNIKDLEYLRKEVEFATKVQTY